MLVPPITICAPAAAAPAAVAVAEQCVHGRLEHVQVCRRAETRACHVPDTQTVTRGRLDNTMDMTIKESRRHLILLMLKQQLKQQSLTHLHTQAALVWCQQLHGLGLDLCRKLTCWGQHQRTDGTTDGLLTGGVCTYQQQEMMEAKQHAAAQAAGVSSRRR